MEEYRKHNEDVGFEKLQTLINEKYQGVISIEKGTEEEDRLKHIDGYLTIHEHSNPSLEGRRISFDVKETKKINRSDEKVSYDYIIIELQGITGYPGSLFGKQEFFIFEHKDSWLVIRRQGIIDFLKENMDISRDGLKNPITKVRGLKVKPFEMYQRPRKQDVFVYIPTEDLRSFATFEIEK